MNAHALPEGLRAEQVAIWAQQTARERYWAALDEFAPLPCGLPRGLADELAAQVALEQRGARQAATEATQAACAQAVIYIRLRAERREEDAWLGAYEDVLALAQARYRTITGREPPPRRSTPWTATSAFLGEHNGT